MKKIIFSIFSFILISNLVHAQEVSKEKWVSAMKTALPAHFCHAQHYFRQCFEVTAVECEEVAASTTRICLSELENKLPNVLVQPKDGALWGNKVGSCAGAAYESSLIKKRISNDKCNNISNWQ